MDYSKSGGAKTGKGTPSHAEHNAKGGRKNPFGEKTDEKDAKSALLARMKAAAERK